MLKDSQQAQVLIVGAGPVGLLLALLLQQHGVQVVIVERQKALYPLPRAVLFDHESRRLFGAAGLSEQVEGVLENVIGKGGEDGTNFVWRDADLKRERSLLQRLIFLSSRRPLHRSSDALRLSRHYGFFPTET